MNQFIYDMIHMTEGEKLINYWWLWLTFFVLYWGGCIIYGIFSKPKPRCTQKEYEEFAKRVFGGDKN